MVNITPFTIKDHLIVNVWAHRKGQSGQMHDEIKANFVLCFNKAYPTEANLYRLKKKNVPNWFCVKCKTK
jgi:hypothetical protein